MSSFPLIRSVESFIISIPRDTPYLGPLGPGESINPRGYLIRQGNRSIYPASDMSVLVKITADDGTVGWGETYGIVAPSAVTSIIDDVRYAPVVLFAADGPFEQYLSYIDMGFDDIITLPENATIVEQRLIAQLDTEHTYFETATYFGPDRRRMEVEVPHQFQRSDAPHSHVRHYFARDPRRGIVVLHSDSYLAVAHQPLRVERVG